MLVAAPWRSISPPGIPGNWGAIWAATLVPSRIFVAVLISSSMDRW